MGRLFNSTFENSLRLLILLDEYDMPQTLDMLYAVDFMALYSASFGVTDQLVLNGTAQAVSYKSGLSYIITPEGEDFCKSLSSEYAREYRKNAHSVIEVTMNQSERVLISAIYKMSAKSFRGEVAK